MSFKSFLRTTALITIPTVAILGGIAFAGYSYLAKAPEMTVEYTESPGTQVINDELSLWQNSFSSGVSYDSFEPARVRQRGSAYFHRHNDDMAAAGRRFGEILLTEDNGSLLYLPRKVSISDEDLISLYIKTSPANKNWVISIYKDAHNKAHITQETTDIETTTESEWQKVTIPYSSLKFEEQPQPELKEDTRDPAYLLSLYQPNEGELYGIEFSLQDGKKDEQIFIDRLSVERKKSTPKNEITGYVKFTADKNLFKRPPFKSMEIKAITNKGEVTAMTDMQGRFTLNLPEGAALAEVFAVDYDIVYSPQQGRFFEIGTYNPVLTIDPSPLTVSNAPKNGNVNDGYIVYEEKFGPRLEANHNFLVQAANSHVIMASELNTNKYGFVDSARRRENPDNAYRVLVLGECHHMGVHITQADLWNTEAEALLNIISEQPIEIISGSFNYSSYTSSWPIFKDYGAEVKPDLVLIPMVDPGVLNLTVEEYMMDWLGAGKGHRTSYQFALDENGVLVHKPNDPDWELYRSPFPEEDHKRVRKQYLSSSYVYEDDSQTPQWVKDNIRLSIESLKEFAKLAKERGQRIGILYISSYGSSKTEPFTEIESLHQVTYDPKKFKPLMENIAKESGIEFFDVSEGLHMSMEGRDKKHIFYPSNGHMSAYGHFRYGQALAREINTIASKEKQNQD